MTERPNHNIPNGHVSQCQVCGNPDLQEVLNLGHQPLCDTLLSSEELLQPEIHFPLRQMWCPKCTLSQLDYVVSGPVVYHPEYPYRSGVTRELAAYQTELARDVVALLKLSADSLVVDIGSNDGTLLSAFRDLGMRVQGVEPTNIAKYAIQAGIETIQEPFTPSSAQKILESRGKAKLVTATNVFAHMQGLGDFLEGLEALVDSDGYFVLENHYLGAVMERLQFDTIYHEHLRTYSLRSLVTLFDYYDFRVVDAMKVSRYGGNIRVVVAKGKTGSPSSRVSEILAEEDATMRDPEYYKKFRDRSIQLKNEFVELAIKCAKSGSLLIGNSCPGRCSTLLNFAGIGPDLMPYIAEQPASLKLGKYLPGKHIPIVNNQRLIDDQPLHVMLLAWHYARPIAEQLRDRGLKSKLYVPMPELALMEI
ncbi:MAG: class I SAM-dependent methyltransferase [Pirellula sp.]|nr:class I SAM-dependent methyltransferase [Pirellula sp.]